MTFEEFKQFAEEYNVIPVSKTLLADTLTPVSAYLRLRTKSRHSFLLESVEGGEHVARYSFIGRNPTTVVLCKENVTTIIEKGIPRQSTENLFSIIDNLIRRFKQPTVPGLPRFTGGLVGYIGYDAISFIEEIPSTLKETLDTQDTVLGLYTTLLAFDHVKHQITIIVNVCVDPLIDLRQQYEQAEEEISALETLLWTPNDRGEPFHADMHNITSTVSEEEFTSMVLKAKEYITEGDIFQVVLSQRFSTSFHGEIFNVYRALRVINPSPYLYFLDFDTSQIIGSSPEILVRVEDGIGEVYPIAGTRKRGTTDLEDRELEQELLADEKERAEHVMLVDLGRNDLGKVCDIGTVVVEQLMFVVRYSHVMHIASRVAGIVSPGKSCVDVLTATFPAGTVSGAPKIRAMEIIDELEATRRGMYAGGVGYFDFSGNMDMCIAIRTMLAQNNKIYFQAGAGIVADSDPQKEYQETKNKAHALVEALRNAEGIRH
jgi:anthranilate synthase component 1